MTSHQLLDRTLRAGERVADVIEHLERLPYPPDDLVSTTWPEIACGDFRVEFDLSDSATGVSGRPSARHRDGVTAGVDGAQDHRDPAHWTGSHA